MSIIGTYQEEINKYKIMIEACIKLLQFGNERDTEFQKERISRLKNEIINHHNYNRISRINKEIDKAKEFHDGDKTWNAALNEVNLDQNDEELKEYIYRLKNFGPKKYLKECIKQILQYETYIKEERKCQKENSKYHNRKSRYKVRPVTINNKVIKKPETLDEIVKKHIRQSNAFIEESEISDIKEQFGLGLFSIKSGYLSEDTIEKLFSLRIVTELLDRHEEVAIISIINTMDSLFDLALEEMAYGKKSFPYAIKGRMIYEMALDEIKETNKDYVEEYAILYEKVVRYCNKLSKEDMEEFNTRLKNSKHIQDNGNLIMPEVFRMRVNSSAIERINDLGLLSANKDMKNIIEEVSNYTKYMNAEELANYYHDIIPRENIFDHKKLQEIFTRLIEQRMKSVNSSLPEEKQDEEKRKRLKATCRDYLNEEPLFMDSTNTMVEPNYATNRIEAREQIKHSEKRYFRMNKYQQAIVFMDYRALRRLNKKEVLNTNEIQRIKGMF